jgi:hypothetical protein
VHISDDSLLLTGGLTQFHIYRFNYFTETWTQVVTEKGMKINSLSEHSVIPVPGRPGTALIHGGRNNLGDYNHRLLWLTDFGNTIQCIRTKGLSPLNRVGTHAVLVDGMLYCIGGDTSATEVPFALSTESWEWTIPLHKFQEKVPQMTGSAMATANGKIYLHGGRAANDTGQPNMYVITPKRRPKQGNPADPEVLSQKDATVWAVFEKPRAVADEPWT